VNLAPQVLTTGDSRAMLTHRSAVQAAGVFQPLHDTLIAQITPLLATSDTPVVCDVGAGTGVALAAVLNRHDTAVGVAVDASRDAAKLAQRAHARIQAVVSDAWQPLPLITGSVDVLFSVFAPRNPAEFRRVITDSGQVVIVTAGKHHLQQLRDAYGLLAVDARKQERIDASFTNAFVALETQTVTWQFACTQALAYAMIAMGPNAHHGSTNRDHVTFAADVTADITVHLFKPRI